MFLLLEKGAENDCRLFDFPRFHYPRYYLSAVHHSIHLLHNPFLNLHFQTHNKQKYRPASYKKLDGIFILSTLGGFRTVCNNRTLGVCRTSAVRLCRVRPGSYNSCNNLVRRGLLPHTFPCFCSSKHVSNNMAFCRADFCGKPF